jgi:hypothetical protein
LVFLKFNLINKENMRLNIIFLVLITFLLSGLSISSNAQVKITDGAVLTLNPNSLLELESINKGLLIPRIAISSLTQESPLTAPVPAGMLVYSTGGSVPDGFYYWIGNMWIRFSVFEIPVTKSASAALLKTETLVLASGDITLTLPTVTNAEDGLAITIKNVGTYTNLITVLPEAGKTIDAGTTSLLTRWVGRTYIASGSNWIVKEKEIRQDNQYEVGQSGSFTTIMEVVAFLNAHMSGPSVVRFGGGTYHIAATQTINLPYPVTFEGSSFGESMVVADAGVSGSPLFICQTESYFKMLKITGISTAPGNDAIRFTGSGNYHEVKDCVFDGFNKGIVTTNNTDLWIFENDFENCTGAGVEIAAGSASGGRLRLSETDFVQCATGINLLSGVSEIVSIINSSFYNTTSGTDIGIKYTPVSFTTFASMIISHNGWNNEGTYVSGFDFTRTDGRDANAFIVSNAGMEDKNPHCKINVANNNTTTTITTAGTFYKANWTNTSFYTTKWTIVDNRITYQQTNSLDAWAIITGDISVGNNNRILSIAIVRNGVTSSRLGETALRTASVSGVPFQFSTVIYIPDLHKDDYLELYVSSDHSGDLVKLEDVQWFTNTQ